MGHIFPSLPQLQPLLFFKNGTLTIQRLTFLIHLPDLPSSPAMLCYAKLLQSCPTLCDPIDGSPSGSPVPGILQARTLEWVAISSSNA